MALNAVRKRIEPGGAAEALRFLAHKAVRKKIQAYGGILAVKEALGTAIPLKTWCARWQGVFEIEIVRLIQQAAWAPSSVEDLKRFPGGPRGDYQAAHATKIAKELANAARTIRFLDTDEYWAEVRYAGLVEALELYAERLLTVAKLIIRIEKSPRFKNLAHKNQEWVLEEICKLTGQPFREKINAIMRAVYPLAGHWPVEAESLARWQRRKRKR